MAMADFAGLMEEFGRNAEKMVVPDLAKRKAMTKAGAEVLKTKLHDETRARHYQAGRKIGKMNHLADSIGVDNKDVDGVDNGNSVVGFNMTRDGFDHARIARFLNDGTKYIVGDGFVDRARHESIKGVFAAEKAVYDNWGGGKHGSTNDSSE